MTKRVFLLLLVSAISNTLSAQKRHVVSAIDSLIVLNQATGSVLIFDPEADCYYSNDFMLSEKGSLPASTFKIPNALIALETGVASLDTIYKWEGEERDFDSWECDMKLDKAFALSCVPVFRSLARDIGVERMKKHLGKLNYGKMDVRADNLDSFWLEGESEVSQKEQIGLLVRLHDSRLPFGEKTMSDVRAMMVRERTPIYTLSGKTGWTGSKGYIGWFVGYVEREGKVYYFATKLNPIDRADTTRFLDARIEITVASLKLLGIIQCNIVPLQSISFISFGELKRVNIIEKQ